MEVATVVSPMVQLCSDRGVTKLVPRRTSIFDGLDTVGNSNRLTINKTFYSRLHRAQLTGHTLFIRLSCCRVLSMYM